MNSLTIFRCTVVATVLSAATLLVSGCIAPLVIGGAAVTTTTVMTDRRTTGTIVSDEVVEKRIAYDVSQALKNKPYHINVTAYEGRVLLSGEATSLEDRRKALTFRGLSTRLQLWILHPFRLGCPIRCLLLRFVPQLLVTVLFRSIK